MLVIYPPYLAGRSSEKHEFRKIIAQDVILNNLILTGLRGVGKTVLLDEFKSIAQKDGWQWAGTDCSESASVTEETIALRLLTDIALITSNIQIGSKSITEMGFHGKTTKEPVYMDFNFLINEYRQIPGLPSDKLKRLLLFIWDVLRDLDGFKGIIFAYDEAQTLSDHSENQQYPFSVLLDLFQYLQKSGARFILILTGLPTLLTKLIETRTYSERLFRVLMLGQLGNDEARDAILKPLSSNRFRDQFTDDVVKQVIRQSGGYPYFLQFICRETYDTFEQKTNTQEVSVPMDAIIQKLDNDFFAGRWARATDRERELMMILAESARSEFGIQEAASLSEESSFNTFSSSQVNQYFNKLIDKGLIYKDRRGSYSFAVPLLAQYILRIQHFDQI